MQKNGKDGVLFAKFIRCVKTFALIKKRDSVLIGASGGPDSTALCYLIKEIQDEYRLNAALAYLNHGLRKKESAREENFVRMLGEKLHFQVFIERADVKKMQKKSGQSLQEAARNIRHDFYARAAEKCGACKIALAHHADDQAETMLMRIVEGTGMEGLTGIHPAREMRGVTVIRPLLYAAKKDILLYLKQRKISFCTDSSNKKLAYRRNAVRKKILPALEKINPGARENLLRLQDIFYHENEMMRQQADKAAKKTVRYADDGAEISLKLLTKLPIAMKRRVLKNALARVRGSSEDVAFRHVESLRRWAEGSAEPLILPGGVQAAKKSGILFLKKETGAARKLIKREAPGKVKLNIPGTKILWDEFTVHAEMVPARGVTEAMLKTVDNEAYLDVVKSTRVIYARRRLPGDRFMPYGMQGEMKLKDFYINRKIRPELRDRMPVFENRKHAVWIPAGRVDERVKVDKHTRNVLHLMLERNSEKAR